MKASEHGLGLIECMFAALLFISCATALLSLTYRWQFHVQRATAHDNLTDKQMWLAARLNASDLSHYLTLSNEAKNIAEQTLGLPVNPLTVTPVTLADTPSPTLADTFSIKEVSVRDSDYSIIEFTVIAGAKAPVKMSLTVNKPQLYVVPDTLPHSISPLLEKTE